MLTKTFGDLKLVQNCLVYLLSHAIAKIVMPWQSFSCFEAPSTASLAALVVAEGSAFDNRSSGF